MAARQRHEVSDNGEYHSIKVIIVVVAFVICHLYFPKWDFLIFAILTVCLLMKIANNLYEIGNVIIRQLRIIKLRQKKFFEASGKYINKKDHKYFFIYEDPCGEHEPLGKPSGDEKSYKNYIIQMVNSSNTDDGKDENDD